MKRNELVFCDARLTQTHKNLSIIDFVCGIFHSIHFFLDMMLNKNVEMQF